jgi:hypothetical protein
VLLCNGGIVQTGKGKIMTPMIKGLGGMTGDTGLSVVPGGTFLPAGVGGTSPMGGGGSSAQDGLGQIDSGAGTVRSAISTAASALGGGGGGELPVGATYKKGGYVGKGGKLNLGSGRVSTTTKNKSNSNW